MLLFCKEIRINKRIINKIGKKVLYNISYEVRMRNKFSELLDVSKLKNILEGLYFISGISSGIIDIDGNA